MSHSPYKQLDIGWVDLEPTIGAETQKKRPCVVLQQDMLNRGSKTLLVAPLLPNHKNWPFAVNLTPSAKNGLDKARHINLKQIRVVDTQRIDKQQGVLEQAYLPLIHQGLKLIFAIPSQR